MVRGNETGIYTRSNNQLHVKEGITMKITKTLTTYLLSSLLIFLLVACGGNDPDLNTLKYMKGIITAATADTLTVETDDGQSYTFSLTGADIEDTSGLKTGIEIEIVYTGHIDGEDTSNTALVRVIAASDSSVST